MAPKRSNQDRLKELQAKIDRESKKVELKKQIQTAKDSLKKLTTKKK